MSGVEAHVPEAGPDVPGGSDGPGGADGPGGSASPEAARSNGIARLIARLSPLVSVAMTLSRRRSFRLGFGFLLVALAVWAVASSRHEIGDAIGQLDARWLVLAGLATVMNVVMAGMVWRTVLADLGSRLPLRVAARVFFVGQLGKYLPGSVWPLVMQTELGRDHHVPARRTGTATVIVMLLSVTSALLVTLLVLPFAPAAVPSGFEWAVVVVVPLVALLHPQVLGRLVDRGLRILGRDGLPERTSLRGILTATAWAVGSWIGAGLQVCALAFPLGAPHTFRTVLLLIGGYSLAWAAGFIVIVAPAGAGAREVALAAVLSTVLHGHAKVVVVVLLSRVMFTIADLVFAGLGVLAARHHRATHGTLAPPNPAP